jgi:hypothetical protein
MRCRQCNTAGSRDVIRQQSQQLRRSLRVLEREGFRRVHVLRSPDEVDATEIVREPLWNNLKHEHGPFDIIGDVHGCFGSKRRRGGREAEGGGLLIIPALFVLTSLQVFLLT